MPLRENVAGTSSNTFGIGDGAAGNKDLQAENGSASPPFVRHNGTVWQKSHDGTNVKQMVFGDDDQRASDETTTSTTSATFQPKITLTTPALTGVYRVAYYVELATGTANRQGRTRLYNSTDATELCIDERTGANAGAFWSVYGSAVVTFTGAAKSFVIEFASQNGVAQISCRRARLNVWRVG